MNSGDQQDRVVRVSSRAEVVYIIDGKQHQGEDVIDYLAAQGFTTAEAQAYIKTLPHRRA